MNYFDHMFCLCVLVSLVGGDSPEEGNVYAKNPSTGIYGPVCDDLWDLQDVSSEIFDIIYSRLSRSFTARGFSSKDPTRV